VADVVSYAVSARGALLDVDHVDAHPSLARAVLAELFAGLDGLTHPQLIVEQGAQVLGLRADGDRPDARSVLLALGSRGLDLRPQAPLEPALQLPVLAHREWIVRRLQSQIGVHEPQTLRGEFSISECGVCAVCAVWRVRYDVIGSEDGGLGVVVEAEGRAVLAEVDPRRHQHGAQRKGREQLALVLVELERQAMSPHEPPVARQLAAPLGPHLVVQPAPVLAPPPDLGLVALGPAGSGRPLLGLVVARQLGAEEVLNAAPLAVLLAQHPHLHGPTSCELALRRSGRAWCVRVADVRIVLGVDTVVVVVNISFVAGRPRTALVAHLLFEARLADQKQEAERQVAPCAVAGDDQSLGRNVASLSRHSSVSDHTHTQAGHETRRAPFRR
jgi:hypothetical protein